MNDNKLANRVTELEKINEDLIDRIESLESAISLIQKIVNNIVLTSCIDLCPYCSEPKKNNTDNTICAYCPDTICNECGTLWYTHRCCRKCYNSQVLWLYDDKYMRTNCEYVAQTHGP